MPLSLRVFISSTSVDLQEFRQAAFKAIHALGGYSDDMIYWSADEREGASLSIDRIKQCDVVILIVAHRYGFIPENSLYSVTEMEYIAAREAGIPVLAFFVDETIPWPPKYIQWEMRDQLKRFKQKIEAEVTRKSFKSTDDLTALVTQSLVAFAERQQQSKTRKKRFTIRTVRAASIAELKSRPDVVVLIGKAEDELPLLLSVNRSQDIASMLSELVQKIGNSGAHLPEAMVKTFQQSIEQHAVESWSSLGIIPVSMCDESRVEMYVTSANLSNLFQPLMAAILGRSQTKRGTQTNRILAQYTEEGEINKLPSIGGQNRFLGMSLLDGHVTSVGQQLEQWVEWQPFLFESIPANFRHGRFIIEGRSGNETLKITSELPLPLYPQSLYDYALDHVDAYGRLDARVYFSLPRQAIGELIVRVATKVAECHTQGRIHGDLKTGNIILSPDGPSLIDAFDLEIGSMSPGWTPDWSAPEQILGEPVTMATDIYPLGRMVSLLLGGLLVGEVRKFKTRPIMGGRDEFDIFYDPFVHLEPGNGVINEKGCNKWLQFARSCLRFNPGKRISSAEVFAQYMRDLLESHPLLGEITVSLPSNLVAATLPDGTDTVARLIKDVSHGVVYIELTQPF